jgi:hypothetical protein
MIGIIRKSLRWVSEVSGCPFHSSDEIRRPHAT